jgi:TonB family protein
LTQYRGDLEDTLPPMPVRELFAASGVTLYVLTTDEAFAATVRGAAGEQYPLFVVDGWAELLAAVESGQCGVALLDATTLRGRRIADCLEALQPYAQRLVTLVAADRDLARELVAFLSSRRIHRLLIKPAAAGATRLLIDSAVGRRLQLREQQDGEPATVVSTPAGRRRSSAWAAGAVAVVVALAGLYWVAPWRVAERPSPTAVAAEVAPSRTSELEQRLAELRARADAALGEGRLAEPRGDGALDHYLTILSLAPADPQARSQLAAVTDALFARAEESLLAGSFGAAAQTLDEIRRVDASSSRLAFLEAQLARAIAVEPAVTPPQPAADAAASGQPSELDSVLSLAAARLRRGELMTPAGDSARAYLERAMRIDGNDERVVALKADVGAALLAAARVLVGADLTAATALANEARGLGVDPAAIGTLDRDLGAARDVAETRLLAEGLALAYERMREGNLFMPAETSALGELQRLQSAAREVAGLPEAWDSFRRAVRGAIEAATAQGDWALADAGLGALRAAPGGAVIAAPLADELGARRLQQAYLTDVAPAAELRLVSAPPVTYPPEAVARGIEGWADVEFVVDRSGATRDAVVSQASPPGRFEAAALAAVASYRYAPFERDGRVFERRVRLRIRFDIQ